MKKSILTVVILVAALTVSLTAQSQAADKKKVASAKKGFADVGACLAPANYYELDDATFAGYGQACYESDIKDEEALARFNALFDLGGKPGDVARIKAFLKYLSGWTTNSVKGQFNFSTSCTNGICDYKMPTGVVIKAGIDTNSIYSARVEGSQLTVDKDLAFLAAQRGVKLGERNALSKLLVKMMFLNDATGRRCEAYKNNDGAAIFAGEIGRNEMILVEALNSAPGMTVDFIKAVLSLRDNGLTPQNTFGVACSKDNI